MRRYKGVVTATTPVYVTLDMAGRIVNVPRMEIKDSVKNPFDLAVGDEVYFTLTDYAAELLGLGKLEN